MSDRATRELARTDPPRAMVARLRAGLCPGCGEPAEPVPADPGWLTCSVPCRAPKEPGRRPEFRRAPSGLVDYQWVPDRDPRWEPVRGDVVEPSGGPPTLTVASIEIASLAGMVGGVMEVHASHQVNPERWTLGVWRRWARGGTVLHRGDAEQGEYWLGVVRARVVQRSDGAIVDYGRRHVVRAHEGDHYAAVVHTLCGRRLSWRHAAWRGAPPSEWTNGCRSCLRSWAVTHDGHAETAAGPLRRDRLQQTQREVGAAIGRPYPGGE